MMKFRVPEARNPGYLGKRFGDLKVRLKLVVLHNFFFLVLTSSVYFTVFPLLEQRISGARSREISLITQAFLADFGDVLAVDEDASALHVIEAQQQVDQG